MVTALFPRKGDGIRAHTIIFQARQVMDRDIGVVSGMTVTRASASSVTVAAGSYKYNGAVTVFNQASITSIPQAAAGLYRVDAIVFDCSDLTLKRIAGAEAALYPVTAHFLDAINPSPPELANASQILLAIIKVGASGIPDEINGHYCTGGVASMVVELPTAHILVSAIKTTIGTPGSDTDVPSEQAVREELDGKISSSLLTTRGDLLGRGASGPVRIPKGLPGQVFVQGADDPVWSTRTFDIGFPFGNGSDVMPDSRQEFRVPIACKIVAARIRELADVTGSVTCQLYKRSYAGTWGAALDSFVISNNTKYEETALNITVDAGDWLSIRLSGVTAMKQITCSLTCEAT